MLFAIVMLIGIPFVYMFVDSTVDIFKKFTSLIK